MGLRCRLGLVVNALLLTTGVLCLPTYNTEALQDNRSLPTYTLTARNSSDGISNSFAGLIGNTVDPRFTVQLVPPARRFPRDPLPVYMNMVKMMGFFVLKGDVSIDEPQNFDQSPWDNVMISIIPTAAEGTPLKYFGWAAQRA